jgi:hypothetical protein
MNHIKKSRRNIIKKLFLKKRKRKKTKCNLQCDAKQKRRSYCRPWMKKNKMKKALKNKPPKRKQENKKRKSTKEKKKKKTYTNNF